MISDETSGEYRRKRHIHLPQEPPVTILNDDLTEESQPVTMHVSVTRESGAYLEPHPRDTKASSAPRCSTQVRSVPVWHKDYGK